MSIIEFLIQYTYNFINNYSQLFLPLQVSPNIKWLFLLLVSGGLNSS